VSKGIPTGRREMYLHIIVQEELTDSIEAPTGENVPTNPRGETGLRPGQLVRTSDFTSVLADTTVIPTRGAVPR